MTPDDDDAFSVRARAHEYGGGSFAVSDGVIYFSNNIDQRLYRQDAGRAPSPITPAPAGAAANAVRYADGVIDRRRGRMVCVSEDHTGAGEAITTLAGVDLAFNALGHGADAGQVGDRAQVVAGRGRGGALPLPSLVGVGGDAGRRAGDRRRAERRGGQARPAILVARRGPSGVGGAGPAATGADRRLQT